MAPNTTVQILLIALFSMHNIHPSSSLVVKGSVSCLDCKPQHDLSGIKVGVKCRNEARLMYTSTNKKGFFRAKHITNSSSSSSSSSLDCMAMILGGPVRLCPFRKSLLSMVMKAKKSNSKLGSFSYDLPTPLSYFALCSSASSKARESMKGRDEKVADWGLPEAPITFPPSDFALPMNFCDAPLIFFFPFLPIIGIP